MLRGRLWEGEEALSGTVDDFEASGGSPEAVLSLAQEKFDSGDLESGCDMLLSLLDRPDVGAAVLNNAGLLLQRMNRLSGAEAAFSRSAKMDPAQEAPLVNLGALLRASGRLQEALAVLLKAVGINPRSAVGWNNMGMLLKDLRQVEASMKAFRMAAGASPQWALPHVNLGTVLSECGDARNALVEFEKAVAIDPGNHGFFSNLLLCLSYLPEPSPCSVVEAHLEYGKRFITPTAPAHLNSREKKRRLRVGFVSADLADHSVGWFFEPLLRELQGSELECICFSNSPARDFVTERLKTLSSGWVETWNRSDAVVEALIRERSIDVLVDLSGHTAGNRLPVFSRKPAPVQMTMIGYLQTSGLQAMDYRITDHWLDPEGDEAAGVAPERLIRLKNGAFGFRLPEGAPEVGVLPASGDGLVFGSFNNLSKLQPEMVKAWAEVLLAIPNSSLLVLGSDPSLLRKQMVGMGVSASRIRHSQRVPLGEFYALLQQVYFALDTFPFNGLTVNLLAAWMGVPTVTMAGGTPHGRAGTAVAERLGYPELVAYDYRSFTDTCIRLAGDSGLVGTMRGNLRERVRLGFGDAAVHARDFIAAVRKAWLEWCSQA